MSSVQRKNITNIEDNLQQKQIFVEIFQQMDSTTEIFKAIAEAEGITITTLEKSIGASKGVLSRAINKGSDVQAKWLFALINKFPDYNYEKLIKGENYQHGSVSEVKTDYPNDTLNQGVSLIRKDIQDLSEGLAQPLERLSDGVFKMLLDQQKILRVAEGVNLDRLNSIGDKLEELLKQ